MNLKNFFLLLLFGGNSFSFLLSLFHIFTFLFIDATYKSEYTNLVHGNVKDYTVHPLESFYLLLSSSG